MSALYRAQTNGDVALVAATAKSILNVINGANALFRITELGVSFESVVAADEPVEVELMSSTQATAGTSTTETIVQIHGPTRAVQASAERAYTVEPTVLTNRKRWLVHPQTGIVLQFPLGREPEQAVTLDGLLLRCIAPQGQNAQAYIEFEEG